MIELAHASIHIKQEPNKVFDFVTNMEHYADWFEGVIKIVSANDKDQFSQGKCYQETLIINGDEVQLTIEVDQCTRAKCFITKGDLAGILPQMTMCFDATENNHGAQETLMQLSYHSREPALANNLSMLHFLREDLSARADKGLSKLKALMEM